MQRNCASSGSRARGLFRIFKGKKTDSFPQKPIVMFIKLTVKNFRSFKAEQTLNFLADMEDGKLADPSLADNTYAFQGARIKKAIALFGANASGKSNVIRAFWYWQNHVLDSLNTDRRDFDEYFQPFKLAAAAEKSTIELIAQFHFNENAYQFEIHVTTNGISFEKYNLVQYDSDRNEFASRSEKDTIYIRKNDKITFGDAYKVDSNLEAKYEIKFLERMLDDYQTCFSLLASNKESEFSLIDKKLLSHAFLFPGIDFGLLTDIEFAVQDNMNLHVILDYL